MTLGEYEALAGVTVSSSQTAKVTATIARTQALLETLLGFTLDPDEVSTNYYSELGKTDENCFCPSVDLSALDDADAVIGAYRLFRYNELDKYFHIDPASHINAVKLVYIKQGSGNNGITFKTFDWDEIRINYGQGGFTKYIEHCDDCLCSCDCTECVQLAVDATWLWGNELPTDLQYLWSDMITWYSDSKNTGIKSETIDTHSYTRFDNKPPETEAQNLAVLKKYAGPYGSVSGMPV